MFDGVNRVAYNRDFRRIQPMKQSRSRYVLLSIAYMAVIFALSSMRVPLPAGALDSENPNWFGHLLVLLMNIAHVPLFGGFTYFVHRAAATRGDRYDPDLRALVMTVLVVLLYSFFDELHQSLTPGRIPSAFDVVLNLIGATMAIGVVRFGVRRFRLAIIALFVVAIVVTEVGGRVTEQERLLWRTVHQRLFGTGAEGEISAFDSERRWGPFPPLAETVRLVVANEHSRHGRGALQVTVPAGGPIGIRSKSMPVDWSSFDEALLDITNPGSAPITVSIGLHPYFGDDTFHVPAELPPGTHVLRFPLKGLGDRIDPRRIRSVRFIIASREAPLTLAFDRLRVVAREMDG